LTEPLYDSRFTTENDDEVDDYWEREISSCDNCECCEYDCNECLCCRDCCNCSKDDKPKTEIQLELNLDNKMTNHWETERFQYLVMLSWLYCHRRPAVGNALKSYYKDENDHHLINPEFSVLKQFTSDEDAYKIYVEYTNHK